MLGRSLSVHGGEDLKSRKLSACTGKRPAVGFEAAIFLEE